jgi:hypothetical protein
MGLGLLESLAQKTHAQLPRLNLEQLYGGQHHLLAVVGQAAEPVALPT